jgi:hypothetical protein
MRTYRGVTAVVLLLLLACGESAACLCPTVISRDLTATPCVTHPFPRWLRVSQHFDSAHVSQLLLCLSTACMKLARSFGHLHCTCAGRQGLVDAALSLHLFAPPRIAIVSFACHQRKNCHANPAH